MAVFHESDATSVGGSKKLSPAMIVVIVLVVLLCCCCAAAAIILIATGGRPDEKIKDLFDSVLPLHLTLQTWL